MRVEIEVDVPDGWRAVAYRQPSNGEWYLAKRGAAQLFGTTNSPWLILEKVEPKRESRWANLYQHTSGMLCRSRDECTDVLSGERVSLIRIDYEDGKPVAVTLEPEEEP